jgi:hypothetical protein
MFEHRQGIADAAGRQAGEGEQVKRVRVARRVPQYLLTQELSAGNVPVLQTLLGLLEFAGQSCGHKSRVK